MAKNRTIKVFDPIEVSAEIMNVFAKYQLSIWSLDMIFDTVRKMVNDQVIQAVDLNKDMNEYDCGGDEM